MLKIKDEIDLEQLKDYGFLNDEEIHGRKVKIKKMMSDKIFNTELVVIDLTTGQLRIFVDDEYYNNYTHSGTLDFIYDLIKNGIVEKVSDERQIRRIEHGRWIHRG